MIDTDKYEGHYTYHESSVELWNTDDAVPNDYDMFWVTNSNQLNANIERANATINLIQDAPLLLEEVKRLYREPRMTIDEWNTKPEGPCVTVYMNGCEYIGCLRLYKNEDGEVIE